MGKRPWKHRSVIPRLRRWRQAGLLLLRVIPQLYTQFQASLGYMRPCFKINETKKTKRLK